MRCIAPERSRLAKVWGLLVIRIDFKHWVELEVHKDQELKMRSLSVVSVRLASLLPLWFLYATLAFILGCCVCAST